MSNMKRLLEQLIEAGLIDPYTLENTAEVQKILDGGNE